jgi:hypothetical protein
MHEVGSFEILTDGIMGLYCIKTKGSSCKLEPAKGLTASCSDSETFDISIERSTISEGVPEPPDSISTSRIGRKNRMNSGPLAC